MNKHRFLAFFGCFFFALSAHAAPKAQAPLYKFQVKDIDGKPVKLDKYKGKVLLIVNTASQCGYTYQYKGLQKIYQKYKAKGFEVLAFPSNDFGRQEPGSDKQIKAFCSAKYKTTFPLFHKIPVRGPQKHPLYHYLTNKKAHKFGGAISWNFNKFLINRKGQITQRFQSGDEPEGKEITQAIEKSL
ncbi:MAG: glutathione peroxidase [Myxococcales bacterium]|nr:glutathione peroxidase [Myxococcales bacterium]